MSIKLCEAIKMTTTKKQLVKLNRLITYMFNSYDTALSIVIYKGKCVPRICTDDAGLTLLFDILPNGKIHIIEFSEDDSLNDTYQTIDEFYEDYMPEEAR